MINIYQRKYFKKVMYFFTKIIKINSKTLIFDSQENDFLF